MTPHNQTTPIAPASDKQETVPANIIFFPAQPCRKAGADRRLAARVPERAALNILRLPQRRTRSQDDVRELFADTGEILSRFMSRC
jgi:hypothetical protein